MKTKTFVLLIFAGFLLSCQPEKAEITTITKSFDKGASEFYFKELIKASKIINGDKKKIMVNGCEYEYGYIDGDTYSYMYRDSKHWFLDASSKEDKYFSISSPWEMGTDNKYAALTVICFNASQEYIMIYMCTPFGCFKKKYKEGSSEKYISISLEDFMNESNYKSPF
ncbi:MAG: hypothetical protein WCH65_08775 [bacterium]